MWIIFLPVVAVVYVVVLAAVVMLKFFLVLAYLGGIVIMWALASLARGLNWAAERTRRA